jgi:tetratricopeptide (TPR) repeat protein
MVRFGEPFLFSAAMKLRPTSHSSERAQSGAEAESISPEDGQRSLRRRYASVVAVAAAGLVVLLVKLLDRPNLEVPVPPNLSGLDPQLREYVREKADWVLQSPRSTDRQATLGMVYAANGLWREARSAFSNVVQLSPEEPLAYLYLAEANGELGDSANAERLLQDLTRRFPAFAPGFYRLGELSLRVGAVDAAEAAFRRLIELAPGEWRGYAGAGEAKLQQGKFDEASKLLERALALEPDAKSAHNLLGLAYRGLGRMDEAKLELTLGLNHVAYPMPDAWSKLMPQHMKLLQDQFDLANELGQSGQAAKAVALLEQALPSHPDDVALLNNLAIALNRAGRPKEAAAVARRALKLNDHYLAAYITLSYTCRLLGQFDQALAAADRALALAPNTAQAYIAKANVFLAMDRDQDALAMLDQALHDDPKNAEIQMEMGDICWRNLNAPDQAAAHYLAATNLNPALAPVYIRLGDFYLMRGDTNAARPVLEMLRHLAPKSSELAQLETRWHRMAHQPERGGTRNQQP